MLTIPDDLRQRLRQYGQEHVLAWWDQLGDGERRLLDEHALAFVPAPTAVEADHDGRERALLAGPARQSGVAARQEHEVAEVPAVQAARGAGIQDDPGEGAPVALGAAVMPSGFDDENGAPPSPVPPTFPIPRRACG